MKKGLVLWILPPYTSIFIICMFMSLGISISKTLCFQKMC
jgi:hypothetical protein